MSASEIPYSLRTHPRSKGVRLTVVPGGQVRVTAPPGFPHAAIDRFVETHRAWVEQKVGEMKKHGPLTPVPRGGLRRHKEAARSLVMEKIAAITRDHPFEYGTVAIRDQRTRWGSCSAKGNLNFNYRIAFLTDRQAEYVVAHELCHLREFNHSPRFWKLVEQIVPEYREIRKQLKSLSL